MKTAAGGLFVENYFNPRLEPGSGTRSVLNCGMELGFIGVTIMRNYGNHVTTTVFSEGKHSGLYRGVQYFSCAQNFGIFTEPHRLVKICHPRRYVSS